MSSTAKTANRFGLPPIYSTDEVMGYADAARAFWNLSSGLKDEADLTPELRAKREDYVNDSVANRSDSLELLMETALNIRIED